MEEDEKVEFACYCETQGVNIVYHAFKFMFELNSSLSRNKWYDCNVPYSKACLKFHLQAQHASLLFFNSWSGNNKSTRINHLYLLLLISTMYWVKELKLKFDNLDVWHCPNHGKGNSVNEIVTAIFGNYNIIDLHFIPIICPMSWALNLVTLRRFVSNMAQQWIVKDSQSSNSNLHLQNSLSKWLWHQHQKNSR